MSEGVAYQQFGRGLLYVAMKQSGTGLFERLSLSRDFDVSKVFPDLEKHVLTLCHPTRKELNSLDIGTFLYCGKGRFHCLQGSLPVFWWPVRSELLQSIVFGEVIITTMFNPAFLVETLQSNGFSVEVKEGRRSRSLRVCFNDGNRTAEFAGFWHYLELIRTSLFTEEQLVSMLRRLADTLLEEKSSDYIRVPIRIQQFFGAFRN